MGWLDILGFETRNTGDDGLTVVAGSPVYDTGITPDGSKSLTCMRGSNVEILHNWEDDTGSVIEPIGTTWEMRFSYRPSSNNTFNDNAFFGAARNGTEVIGVSFEDNTNKFTIRVAGSVVGTAVVAAAATNTWAKFVLKVDQQTGGLVQVFLANDLVTPVVSYTLLAGDITALPGKPNQTRCKNKSSTNDRFDDVMAVDPNDATYPTTIDDVANSSIKPHSPSSDGNSTDWIGGFGDIDEVPFSDSDKISATAVGQKSDFGFPAIGEDLVQGVRAIARVQRVGTDAGSNIRMYQREGGLETNLGTQSAPAAGGRSWISKTQRDGSNWGGVSSSAEFDAHTWGFESIL